jgi:hypothetical protein
MPAMIAVADQLGGEGYNFRLSSDVDHLSLPPWPMLSLSRFDREVQSRD